MVRDFDFHPDEDDVRVFITAPGGVLRITDDVYVSAGRSLAGCGGTSGS